MAFIIRSDLDVDKSLVWSTKLPNINTSWISSTFSLMGSEWCLRFVYCDGGRYNCIYLQRMKDGKILRKREALETTFCVRAYMMHMKYDGVEYESVRTKIIATTECIWNSGYEKGAIFKKLTWLYQIPQVLFTCKFYGHPRSTLQLTIETGNTISFRSVDKSIQVTSEVPQDIEALSNDFCHCLEKEILPDVKLECGSQTFQAHRSILAARSEVLRAMFRNKMLESKTGVVKISDVTADVLKKLLKFIYSGKTGDLLEDNIADLYQAADKYDVVSLKAACSYWMIRNVTVENCVEFLQIGSSHSDPELKSALISFIVDNPSVMNTSDWFALSKDFSLLANEVMQAYITSTLGPLPKTLRTSLS